MRGDALLGKGYEGVARQSMLSCTERISQGMRRDDITGDRTGQYQYFVFAVHGDVAYRRCKILKAFFENSREPRSAHP